MRHIGKLLTIAALVGLMATLTLSAAAQDDDKPDKKGKNAGSREDLRGAKPSKAVAEVSDLNLAYSLAAYGRKHKSPVALLAAARILAKIQTQDVKNAPTTEPVKKGGKEAEPVITKAPPFTALGLLAEARKMSKSNEHIAVLATAVEKLIEEPRGDVLGPFFKITTLPGQMRDTYKATLRANELTTIRVTGSGTTDLDLFIYDENMNLVDQDIGLTDKAVCFVNPRWTGVFYIRVVNLGFVPNTYIISWN
jgi:hypothetical protein